MNMIASFSKHATTANLPIMEVLGQVREILDRGRNLVLIAPPGAGKTSLVPLSLLDAPWRNGKTILLVAPRRVAVRGAAQRMAQLVSSPPGQRVGYTTRLERMVSRDTEIEVVTEGLFLRRLLQDPFLERICAVIFDEAHERSLELDTGLAMALSAQHGLRSDLRLIAMSATLAGEEFAQQMHAETVVSKGRAFHLTIHHAARDIQSVKDLPARAAAQVCHALDTVSDGHILVFLPGMREIRQTEARLTHISADVLTLHGDLPVATQDRVFRQGGRRKVILATAIAETSITIPGTGVVIDSGFRRAPRFDQGTGLTRLETVRISRAAATQRAGRAGREGPGTAFRLWSEAAQRGLNPHDPPEIASADLSALVLQLMLWQDYTGLEDAADHLLLPPTQGALEAGRALLRDLGAIDAGGLTAFGRDMARFGTHPRLAAILCTAQTPAARATACIVCALLEERDPLANHAHGPQARRDAFSAEVSLRIEAIENPHNVGGDPAILSRIRASALRYRATLNVPSDCAPDMTCIGPLLASGFPDRIAKAVDHQGQFYMASGGRVHVGPRDTLVTHRFIVAARVRMARAVTAELAAPISPETFPPSVLDTIRLRRETSLDPVTGKVMAREKRSLGRLILSERTVTLAEGEIVAILLEEAQNDILGALDWSADTRQFQERIALARRFRPDLPDISPTHLAGHVAEWLGPWLTGCRSRTQMAAINLLPILRALLEWKQLTWLDENFPISYDLPRSRVTIDYSQDAPSITARAQAFYGCKVTPTIMGGAITLQCILLSPAGRPQAITGDLTAFWRTGWQDMRKEMRGRYPKHDWPENPANAMPPQASQSKPRT